jgi:hypothetical protein
MNLFLASTADLYAEHRRTQSRRKREKIAAELQRRHDAIMQPAGHGLSRDKWYWPTGEHYWHPSPWEEGGGHYEPHFYEFSRFQFALWLP